jgi:glycosyltransferase involved in cell wall biosynthesis
LPAIASNIGAIPTIITEGVEGFLIETGDVDALSQCICRLANDPSLRRGMGRNARQRIERDFSQQVMARRVFRIYQNILTGKIKFTNEDDLQADRILA